MAVGWLDTERGPTCVCGMPTYVTLVDVGPKKLTLLVCFAHDGVGASLTPNDARNLAAWLLVMADATDLACPDAEEPAASFDDLVKAIRAS